MHDCKAEESGTPPPPVEASKIEKYFLLFSIGCFGTNEVHPSVIALNTCDKKWHMLGKKLLQQF